MKKKIPANVVVLGIVSFLTDCSTDMIYPLLPLFLVRYLGAGQGYIGLIEGVAESTAAFFTLFSGMAADRSKDRSKIVLAGYSISAFCRPLVAIARAPWVVLAMRFFDRVGKGVRTSPRDALIADSVSPDHHGKAFGFQRGMDNAGAVAGPLIAVLLMSRGINNLRHIFLLASVPGILSVFLIFWKVREVLPLDRPSASVKKFSLRLPHGKLRVYLMILFVFILGRSTDAFLLLRAVQLGVPQLQMPLLWLVFNAVKAVTNYPLGALSDKIGRRRVILAGWIIYAVVYAGFGFASSPLHAWLIFIVYGLYYGFTEGSERALMADLAPPESRGQAFGWYYFLVGLGSLPASLLFGWLWQIYGAAAAFLISAVISACAASALSIFLLVTPSSPKRR